jgi:hypothetical protein
MIKKIARIAVGALFLAVITTATANAQTNSYRTNVLLNLTFSLTAYEQTYIILSTNAIAPTAKASKVATDGVIRAIARQAHITNDLSNAKLYWRRSWTNADDVTSNIVVTSDIIIRRGTEDTVVNNFFFNFEMNGSWDGQEPGSLPNSVTTLRATLAGATNTTDYANCNISLHSSLGSFSLQGIATVRSGSLYNGKSLIDRWPSPISFTASVAGSGSIGFFHRAEWKGTVMGSGQKVEIEQISP